MAVKFTLLPLIAAAKAVPTKNTIFWRPFVGKRKKLPTFAVVKNKYGKSKVVLFPFAPPAG
ncbi:hypothetical protein EVA_16536 [gut metagenome]|uniref:Uncharacterized protein n=1 Tax=gut metagenome TaxID=749906 RepID=J9FKB8_9ZZZZ